MPDGWVDQIIDACAGEWLLFGHAEEIKPDGLHHAQIRLTQRRAPGHVSPLTILVDAVERNPNAVLELLLLTVRKLSDTQPVAISTVASGGG